MATTVPGMGVRRWLEGWPVYRQLTGPDRTARAAAAKSDGSEKWHARTEDADKVVRSICPYCAVGCGQKVYVKDGRVTQIEGDPDSPISRGRLCPKGSASKQLVTSPSRVTEVRYRRPYGTEWERLPPPRHGGGGARPRRGDGHDRRPGHRAPAGHLA